MKNKKIVYYLFDNCKELIKSFNRKFNKFLIIGIAGIILFPISCFTTTWHIDPMYTGENGNGLSWDSPWKAFSNIIWTQIRPGDVIELAAGNFGSEALTINKGGTSDAPLTIQLATDPIRRGHVYLRAVSFSNYSWIHINGAINPLFNVPPSVHDLWQITNNIGIHLQNPTGPGIYMRGSTTGNKILWTMTYRCGEQTTGQKHGIHINGDTRLAEIGYCWIHEQHWGDGINRGSGIQPNRFDDLIVHDTIITKVGNDAMQIGGGGADIYRCIIDGWDAAGDGGHPDCFQTWGSNYRIHHNIIVDFSPGENYYASLAYAQMSNPINGNFLLYNNLFINEKVPTETGFIFLFDAWWSPNKHNTNVIITNLFIANNLWHIWKSSAIGHTFHYKSDKARGTNDFYTITNCYFLNNAVIGCNDHLDDATGVSLASTNLQPSNIDYDKWMFDYNIVSGPSSKIRYMGNRPWNNAEALNAVSPFKHNSSQLPLYNLYAARTPPYDFHLQTNDVVALGKGTNLTSWVEIAPMLNVDLDGLPRSIDKAWDIGPYQLTEMPPDECAEIRQQLAEALEQIRVMKNESP
jgi:hypothetical protein